MPSAHVWTDGVSTLCLGDSLNYYNSWDSPQVIVSDGAYGVPGFEGDTADHLGIANWYEPHVRAWREKATAQFNCPVGVTDVWDRNPLKGAERIKVDGKATHLNQKPLDLMARIIEASSHGEGVVWEPFGGLFSASLAAQQPGRRSFASEIDVTYYQVGLQRFIR